MKKTVVALAVLASQLPVAAQTSTQPPAPATPPPVAHFAHTGQFDRFLLSPDGSRVAGLVRVKDKRLLVHQRADGSERRIALALDKADLDVELLRWLGEKHLLVRVVNYKVVQIDALPFPNSRLLAMPLDGSKPRVLAPESEAEFNHVSTVVPQACPTSPQVLMPFPASAASGGVVRFQAGHAESEGAADHIAGVREGWWADAQGQVRAAMRVLDGEGMELLWRPSSATSGLPGSWKTWRRFSRDEVKDWQILGFDADPQHLIVRAPHEGGSALLRYTLGSEAAPELLQLLPAGAHVQQLLRNETDCRVVGARTRELHLWGDRLLALQGGVEKALGHGKVQLTQWQGDRYVMRFGGPNEPSEFLVGSRQRGELARSEWPIWPLSGKLQLQQVELDGATLWHPGGSTRPLPLVICLHCELHQSDSTGSFRPLRALLLSRGYAVLEPDPWRSDGGQRLDRLDEPLARLDAALAAARASGWVDGDRVALLAHNQMSAYLGLRWAMQRESGLRAIVVGGALSNLETVRSDAANLSLTENTRRFKRLMLGDLDKESLKAVSPVHQAARLRAPTLLLHGARDARLAASHSLDLHAALRKAGISTQLKLFEHSDSELDHPPYRLEAMEAIEAWLLKYL